MTAEIKRKITDFSSLVKANPQRANCWSDLAVALRLSGHTKAAIALYRRALQLEPESKAVLSNLGGALRAIGEIEEAILLLRKVVSSNPDFIPAQYNLGLALEDAGQLEEACNQYQKVIAIDRNKKDAVEQLAFTLLRRGMLKEGFTIYERRFEFEPQLRRNFKQPQWNGSDDLEKVLLLYAEQGRGDTLQFIRYVKFAKSRVKKVVVECSHDLKDLVQTVEGVDAVYSRGEPFPAFDIHASLMSLPHLFQTDLSSIPWSDSYIQIPAGHRPSFLLETSSLIKVGIVWASGHSDFGAHERTVSLQKFLPLLENPRCMFYSLQVGEKLRELYDCGLSYFVQDLGREFQSFADTAFAISHLDLVISVDTAVVHLAGALGKPAWVLLPYANEWRWLQNRSDSPWYPTLKLYRQKAPLDWGTVFQSVEQDLKHFSLKRVMQHEQ